MDADWIEICRVEAIPRQGARTVQMAGTPVALFRTADDEIFALVNICPHRSGPLSEGIVFGRTVACPLHDWLIDLASGTAQAPDIGCTPTVPVRIVGDRIFLATASLSGNNPAAAASAGCSAP